MSSDDQRIRNVVKDPADGLTSVAEAMRRTLQRNDFRGVYATDDPLQLTPPTPSGRAGSGRGCHPWVAPSRPPAPTPAAAAALYGNPAAAGSLPDADHRPGRRSARPAGPFYRRRRHLKPGPRPRTGNAASPPREIFRRGSRPPGHGRYQHSSIHQQIPTWAVITAWNGVRAAMLKAVSAGDPR